MQHLIYTMKSGVMVVMRKRQPERAERELLDPMKNVGVTGKRTETYGAHPWHPVWVGHQKVQSVLEPWVVV